VICPVELLPARHRAGNIGEDGYCLRIDGPFGLAEPGMPASVVEQLAAAGISVFDVATFDTGQLRVTDLDGRGALCSTRDTRCAGRAPADREVRVSAMSTDNPWVVRRRMVPQPRLRLFCFPFAGGGATVYRDWPRLVPPDVEVCAVQPPGRESRLGEDAFTRLHDLLPPLAGALGGLLDVPFVTFGHSLGSLVGFELARYLRRHGGPLPQQLIVSGRRPPQGHDQHEPMHKMDDERLLETVLELNGTSPEIREHPELLELAIPLLRADFAVSETYEYTPEPPLPCPITAFSGLADPHVTRSEAAGWAEHTSGGFALRMLPGDHFFLTTAQGQLLAEISHLLAGLQPGAGAPDPSPSRS
jgi:medium-chain acyl-[acyl-carrier-protein] hydrolase